MLWAPMLEFIVSDFIWHSDFIWLQTLFWQCGANSQISFAGHPCFENSGNIDRPSSLYDNVFGPRLIPADLLAHPCGFWGVASPQKGNVLKTAFQTSFKPNGH